MSALPRDRCRILVAEDDPSLQKLIATALRRRLLYVEVASNGAEAIVQLKSGGWSALVLDLVMPTLSGWDVIAWLANNQQYRPRSVIVVSATDRAILRELDPKVVNAIIFKPFDVFALGAYIKATCELSTADRRHARIVDGY